VIDFFAKRETPDDWRVEWVKDGEADGRWVQGNITRQAAIEAALRAANIFDKSTVSCVTIRKRKEITRWTKPTRRAW